MRRAEFQCHDKELLQEILHTTEYGIFALCHDAIPYTLPLNFVWLNEKIYAHGAKEGKKVELIHANPNASFSVVKPLSLIPSYFSNTTSACPATQLFISVHMQGVLRCVDHVEEKADALNALMQKLQPEGGYEVIAYSNPIYKKMLETIGVFEFSPNIISLKLKAGQNLSGEKKRLILEALEKRGTPLDKLSIKAICDATSHE